MKIPKLLFLEMLIASLVMLAATPALAAPAAANLDQARNGSASSPTDPVVFVNGNLNSSQAHFVEGYSVIYRCVMTNLPTATSITLTLGYDIKHSGKHAIDYLTHFNRINNPLHSDVFGHPAETINPLDGVTGVSGTTTTYQIPAPSSTDSPVPGQPTDSFHALPAGESLMTLFGGTITGIAYVSQGDLNADQSETQISVTFTVDGSSAVLAWGGHIASREDWGYDSVGDPMSAGGISGSPYHMRLIGWNLNNLGNQDRSLQSASVYVPPEPAIDIEKATNGEDADDPTGPEILFGNTVTWTYEVTNTGNVALSSVVVIDDNGTPGDTGDDFSPTLISGDTDTDGELDTDEIWIYQANDTAVADQYANLVCVDAYYEMVLVGDCDPSHYFGSAPSIDIEKYVWDGDSFEDADDPTGPYLTSTQDPVVFQFVITNDGNVDLTNVTLSDVPAIATFYTDQALTSLATFPTTLAASASVIVYGSLDWAEGQQTDTATSTGTPPIGDDVSDTDPANYFGSDASIDVEKYVWDGDSFEDADDPTGPYLASTQDPVVFQFVITNDGNVDLTNVTLSDVPAIATFYTDQALTSPATFPTTLAVSASVTVYGSLDWAAGQQTDTATANGTPPAGDDVSDTDPANYFGSDPSIHIEKRTNSEDADDPTGPEIQAGNTVTWTYEVTNTGNVALTNIAVMDDNGTLGDTGDDFSPTYVSGDTDLDSELDIDEIWIYEDVGTAEVGQYANEACVSGWYTTVEVTDCDPSHYLGQDPGDGEEGCTPGFWKNQIECWECYYDKTYFVGDVFTIPGELSELEDDTLMDALNYRGGKGLIGKARNLLRIAVAAVLNACDPDVNYPMSESEIFEAVDDALDSEDQNEISSLQSTLDYLNNLGCPIDAHCYPIDE